MNAAVLIGALLASGIFAQVRVAPVRTPVGAAGAAVQAGAAAAGLVQSSLPSGVSGLSLISAVSPALANPGLSGPLSRVAGVVKGPRLLITGPPGSGKTTQAKKLEEETGVVRISAGNLLREYAKEHPEVSAVMNAGKLVDTKIVVDLVRKRLSKPDVKERGYIFDGFPRRRVELEVLRELLGPDDAPDAMIRLEVPEAELRRRIALRGRADDTPAVFSERMKVYRDDTVPVLDELELELPTILIPYDGGDSEAVAARLRARLKTRQ